MTILSENPMACLIEKNGPNFDRLDFLEMQKKSKAALKTASSSLSTGLTELEAVEIVQKVLRELGSEKSWHAPIVRFAKNTSQSYKAAINDTYRAQSNDVYFIDIGPVWRSENGVEYEGDAGDTFVFGTNTGGEACANATRALFDAGCAHWRSQNPSGRALYEWLAAEAERLGYVLVKDDDGHRVGDFPHKRIFSGSLAEIDFCPKSDLWILEIHLRSHDGEYGAFFEDILS